MQPAAEHLFMIWAASQLNQAGVACSVAGRTGLIP